MCRTHVCKCVSMWANEYQSTNVYFVEKRDTLRKENQQTLRLALKYCVTITPDFSKFVMQRTRLCVHSDISQYPSE